MEKANKDNFNIINGDKSGNHKEGLEKFKALLQKIKAYKDDPNKPKKILIATDADACLFRGHVTSCAGQMGMGVMSDMVYVYHNIFKLCEEADIKCDFCFLTKLQPYQCNPFFKQQLSERLGKDKKGQPFIKPEDIKFAPYDGKNDDIDHDSFNKKMFEEGGCENTEVLYFDNDLDGKIENFKENFNKNLKSKGHNESIKFPVNIIHTEDVKNWITKENVRDNIAKKQVKQDWDMNEDKLKSNGWGRDAYIKCNTQNSRFEQKTGKYAFIEKKNIRLFNKDGLNVSDLLRATQEFLFNGKPVLKMVQNEWILQNFKNDKALANKLYSKFSLDTNPLFDYTMNKKQNGEIFDDVFYKVTKDTFENIKKDKEVQIILNRYRPDPETDIGPFKKKKKGQVNSNKVQRKKLWMINPQDNYDKCEFSYDGGKWGIKIEEGGYFKIGDDRRVNYDKKSVKTNPPHVVIQHGAEDFEFTFL